ncbi:MULTISPECIES: hypothetical protein [Sphingomonas]|jgi:hypothetical protein|uniref:Uncharacterized protein n=1 Tax=Sphingomonas hankookensis TaxID=563996 RepID=A0ABR5Y8T6_9SPHN|nr:MULTISPECIES: hypothetical protein [Sphingomonas]KZE10946.1 hypothetical protein AVT10_06235 [Sphingomonas hankookensis]PZT91921.1 MAG: hypothetical protein DI625_14380 [Sphingomonas sp.]RSV31523.1 hypothetical protein CA237_06245 [Sphingomonas sp. ABOLH]WCP71616.1 hypothetical protein PPZ50_14865 [Sphingomonas hankookensis]
MPHALHEPQSADLTLRAGRKLRLRAGVHVTPAGLLSIGALVSSILLSSAAIVVAARIPARDREKRDVL